MIVAMLFHAKSDGTKCNANSTSFALNKWLKVTIGNDSVIYGLKYSPKDRLLVVECPSNIIDQVGVWSLSSVDASSGGGYEVPVLAKSMKVPGD